MISFFNKIFTCLVDWTWDFGIMECPMQQLLEGGNLPITYIGLNNIRDRWFADPFILDCNDSEIFVLCEEMGKGIGYGRIAKLILDRNTYQLKEWNVLLDTNNHLSFPIVDRNSNSIYPENCASGRMREYYLPNDIISQVDHSSGFVICDEPIVDAVKLNYQGNLFLFATTIDDASGKCLKVYSWNSAERKYIFSDKIEFPYKKARMAGDFFYCNGKLYRPAQDCEKTYGGAVVIDEVSYENGKWQFKEVRRIVSTHNKLNFGCHTFNTYKGLTIIDVKGFTHPILVKMLRIIRNLLRRITLS